MNKQIEFWQGVYGDIYQTRDISEVEYKARRMVWRNILNQINPESFLEVGPAQGVNLKILKELNSSAALSCVEINALAREKLVKSGYIRVYDHFPTDLKVDCSFTWGVLIHTHPDNLLELMGKMYRRTNKYIICVEYFSPKTVNFKEYYGGPELTWSADYGRCWVEEFGLKVVSYGFCWDYATKLDNVTYWVMEKPQ